MKRLYGLMGVERSRWNCGGGVYWSCRWRYGGYWKWRSIVIFAFDVDECGLGLIEGSVIAIARAFVLSCHPISWPYDGCLRLERHDGVAACLSTEPRHLPTVRYYRISSSDADAASFRFQGLPVTCCDLEIGVRESR